MASSSVIQDIRKDLDGLPSELIADIKKLIDDATPAVTAAMKDARTRGAAVGTTLVGHVPDQVLERVPDKISDRLPGTSPRMSTGKRLLLLGGLGALVAAAVAAWKRSSASTTSAAHRPTSPAAPSANGHRASGPQSLEQEIAEQPGQMPN